MLHIFSLFVFREILMVKRSLMGWLFLFASATCGGLEIDTSGLLILFPCNLLRKRCLALRSRMICIYLGA